MPDKDQAAQALISIHVPKTGGTSLADLLGGWYGESLRSHYVDEARKLPPKLHALAAAGCIHGHFNRFRGFGVDDYYPQADRFIIFLRDPFEQHVSLYRYIAGLQAQYRFAGDAVPFQMLDSFSAFFEFVEASRMEIQTSFANTFLAHLPARFADADAKTLHEAFIHIGLTECLEESAALLAHKLKKPRRSVTTLNASRVEAGKDAAHWRKRHQQIFLHEHALYQALRTLHLRELRLAR